MEATPTNSISQAAWFVSVCDLIFLHFISLLSATDDLTHHPDTSFSVPTTFKGGSESRRTVKTRVRVLTHSCCCSLAAQSIRRIIIGGDIASWWMRRARVRFQNERAIVMSDAVVMSDGCPSHFVAVYSMVDGVATLATANDHVLEEERMLHRRYLHASYRYLMSGRRMSRLQIHRHQHTHSIAGYNRALPHRKEFNNFRGNSTILEEEREKPNTISKIVLKRVTTHDD